jgi:hypothetical protein
MDFIFITGVWESVARGLRELGGMVMLQYDAPGAVSTVGQPTAGP